MSQEIGVGDIKVAALTAFLVVAIGSLGIATAAEPAPDPQPKPVPQEILDKCANAILPGLCVEIELTKAEIVQ